MTFRSITALALLLSTTGVGASAAVAQAAPAEIRGPLEEPGQKTHCLALGQSFQKRKVELVEQEKQFDHVFPAPSASEKQLQADMAKLIASTGQLADALISIYGDAKAPARSDREALDARSLHDLIPDVRTCLS